MWVVIIHARPAIGDGTIVSEVRGPFHNKSESCDWRDRYNVTPLKPDDDRPYFAEEVELTPP